MKLCPICQSDYSGHPAISSIRNWQHRKTSISFSSYCYFPCYNLFIEIRKIEFLKMLERRILDDLLCT